MQEEIQAAEKIINVIVNFFVNYSFQVVGAIIVLLLGLSLRGQSGHFYSEC